MAFRGHYEHTLDVKNRLTVPSRFRTALADGVVLARAFEPCVSVWTPTGWESFTQRFLEPLDPFSERSRKLQRYFNAGSFDTDLDSAGRLMVPAPLMDHAKLDKEVAVVGNSISFEIWDRPTWAKYERGLADTVLDDAENLASST